MFHPKRFLLLGSLGILLCAGLVFTFSPKAPSAHAACSQGCANNPCPPGLSENDSSNNTSWVEVLQFALNSKENSTSHGFSFSTFPLSIDGNFGSMTETGVVAFQNWANISGGGGAVGDRTWAALGFCNGTIHQTEMSVASGTTCPQGQSESSSDPVFVMAIQDLLNQDYSFFSFSTSSPDTWAPFLASDGSFGTQTHNAVADWQAFEGISGGGGAVGDRTWRSLEMCY